MMKIRLCTIKKRLKIVKIQFKLYSLKLDYKSVLLRKYIIQAELYHIP